MHFGEVLFATCAVLGMLAEDALAQANQFRRFDINWNVISYSRQGSANQYGGTLGFAVNLNPALGIVADLGAHQPDNFNITTYTYRFGPRFSTRSGNRVTLFGQLLAGGVRFTSGPSSVNGFSLLAGGGVDIGIRPWFAIRAIEGGYSGLHAVSAWSNGARLSTGVVFRFGE